MMIEFNSSMANWVDTMLATAVVWVGIFAGSKPLLSSIRTLKQKLDGSVQEPSPDPSHDSHWKWNGI